MIAVVILFDIAARSTITIIITTTIITMMTVMIMPGRNVRSAR